MRRKVIMIITSSIDETSSYIMEKYRDQAEIVRLNVDQFGKYAFSISECGWDISDGEENYSEQEIYSIYYRKPMLPELQEYKPQYHSMIQRDIIAVINGIADSFCGKVLTKPSVLRKTENKIFQLIHAGKNGICLPCSYIGNSNEVCEKFARGDSIIKPISTGKTYRINGCELYQTKKFNNFRDDVRLTPVYLQEYIIKYFEVRITVIDGHFYTVRIDTDNKIDWRADYSNHKYSIIECPNEIKKQCLSIMADFNLKFGAFDYVVTLDNKWVFLEVNPNGQWLWLEKSLGLDISQKIVDYLLT